MQKEEGTPMIDTVKTTIRDKALVRWLVLLLISGLMFSTYWFYDMFSGLKELMEFDLGLSSEEFGRVLGSTALANIFGMIIIGGIFLDRFGIRLSGLVFGGLATLGGIITAGATAGWFGDEKSSLLLWLIIGRLLFGSGLEIVCVIVTRTVVKWFKGYELALAMAISVAFGRLGTALAIAVSLDIAGATVSPAVTFGASLIALSMLMFLVYLIFDIKIDKQTKGLADAEAAADDEQFRFSDLVKLATDKSFIYISLLCVAFYAAVFPFLQYAPDLLVNKFGFTFALPEGAAVELFGSAALGNAMIYVVIFIFALAVTLVPTNLKKREHQIVSVAAIVGVFAVGVFLFRETLGIWLVNGPKTASLIPLATIVFTPIFGTLVDRKGKAASLMIVGSLLLIVAHVSLSVLDIRAFAYLGLVCLGIAFSLVPAAMWPSVAKIVAENKLGTAYATMFTVQNWGLGAFFWGIGQVLDLVNPKVVEAIRVTRQELLAAGLTDSEVTERIREMRALGELAPYDYTIPILVLVGCGVISIFLAYQLKRADHEQGYGLERPSNA